MTATATTQKRFVNVNFHGINNDLITAVLSQYDIDSVMDALINICYEKAQHIESDWQESGDIWSNAGDMLTEAKDGYYATTADLGYVETPTQTAIEIEIIDCANLAYCLCAFKQWYEKNMSEYQGISAVIETLAAVGQQVKV